MITNAFFSEVQSVLKIYLSPRQLRRTVVTKLSNGNQGVIKFELYFIILLNVSYNDSRKILKYCNGVG